MPRAAEFIKRDVVDQLAWDSRVNANEIEVKVNDNTVTLTGTVPSFGARLAAERDTRTVLGVQRVQNLLTVAYPSSISVPIDGQIQSNIDDLLRWDPAVEAANITAQVVDGRVTLEGTVDAVWKKTEVERRVSNVGGVRGVANKLVVVPTRNITDQMIAEAIENALDRNMLVDVESIDVQVEDAVVNLYGTVATWAVDQTVYNTALFTNGVADVYDNLIIADL
jgi:osmotically-inducible protein OsmY